MYDDADAMLRVSMPTFSVPECLTAKPCVADACAAPGTPPGVQVRHTTTTLTAAT